MYEELIRLLEGRAAPELTAALVALDGTLVRAGFTMHREEIDYLLTLESTIDPATLSLNVTSILRIGASKVLDLFEVSVSDEIPLDRLTALIGALSSFGPSDNYEALDAIIKDTHAADETLCDILEQLTEYAACDYYPYITGVGENLITLIEQKIEAFAEVMVDSSDIPSETKARIEAWRATAQSEFADTLAQNGVPLGTDMESMYKYYVEGLVDLSVESAVKNLVYLGLYSSVSNEAMADEVAHYLEDLYPDVERNQKANLALRKEMASLESILNVGD